MMFKEMCKKMTSLYAEFVKSRKIKSKQKEQMSKEELLKHIAKWMYAYQEQVAKNSDEAEAIEKVYDEVEDFIKKAEIPQKNDTICSEATSSTKYDYAYILNQISKIQGTTSNGYWDSFYSY